MKDMMAKAHLMVMVSHDLSSIETICDKVIWMDHGSIRMYGPSGVVVKAYQDSVRSEAIAA
jgi:ABC-type polysaccharide/polyol phosphate transport system ATPase subunit